MQIALGVATLGFPSMNFAAMNAVNGGACASHTTKCTGNIETLDTKYTFDNFVTATLNPTTHSNLYQLTVHFNSPKLSYICCQTKCNKQIITTMPLHKIIASWHKYINKEAFEIQLESMDRRTRCFFNIKKIETNSNHILRLLVEPTPPCTINLKSTVNQPYNYRGDVFLTGKARIKQLLKHYDVFEEQQENKENQ